ncbi:MAG: (d)CMP kinase [Gemmatimonadetes bacterium]|nr:(d)CMP kinase [Gemmatimonadota bacterium]
MTDKEGPVVTLDGPAGSGKSSTAHEVSRRLKFRHLDSGALYRALTLALLQRGIAQQDWPVVSETDLLDLDVDIQPTTDGFIVLVGGHRVDAELRSPEVTAGVSHLAKLPAVRASLLELQRRAGAHGRLVADGRDMGTVVFPHAEVKVFLVADVEERARRRMREQGAIEGDVEELERQVQAIEARDRRDSERELSPLRRAADAHEIDTTRLDFDHQVEEIISLVYRLTTP